MEVKVTYLECISKLILKALVDYGKHESGLAAARIPNWIGSTTLRAFKLIVENTVSEDDMPTENENEWMWTYYMAPTDPADMTEEERNMLIRLNGIFLDAKANADHATYTDRSTTQKAIANKDAAQTLSNSVQQHRHGQSGDTDGDAVIDDDMFY